MAPGEKLPYAALVGKWLNLDRARARFAQDVAEGVRIALGGTPSTDFLRALARTEAEAADLAFEARARAREAEVAAEHGF